MSDNYCRDLSVCDFYLMVFSLFSQDSLGVNETYEMTREMQLGVTNKLIPLQKQASRTVIFVMFGYRGRESS